MQNQFKEFVKYQHLFKPTESILLAVSGGIDSVVMMHLFEQTGFLYAVAHMNFGLRGAASDADADFVGEFCERHGISFFTKKVDTIAYAEKQGISTQMAARELRYIWFGELLEDKGFSKIATAHHLNDSLETVLLNLSKGTGIAGLAGIPLKNGDIIRPLSFASRGEIENYAHAQQLTWREDVSNQSSKYQRNFIRHEVIPSLKKINPNLENTFLNTLERVQGAHVILQEQIESIKRKAVQYHPTHTEISIRILAQTSAPVFYLDALLKVFGFGYAQVKQIWETHQAEAGKVFYSNEFMLNKDRAHFLITSKPIHPSPKYSIEATQPSCDIKEFSLYMNFVAYNAHFKIPRHHNILAIDADKLRFPLQLRIWQQGDSFYPLGMQGKKKVSDFLIDLKVPLILKEKVWVLCQEQEIIAVLGHRLDDRYKITEHTKSVFLIEKTNF